MKLELLSRRCLSYGDLTSTAHLHDVYHEGLQPTSPVTIHEALPYPEKSSTAKWVEEKTSSARENELLSHASRMKRSRSDQSLSGALMMSVADQHELGSMLDMCSQGDTYALGYMGRGSQLSKLSLPRSTSSCNSLATIASVSDTSTGAQPDTPQDQDQQDPQQPQQPQQPHYHQQQQLRGAQGNGRAAAAAGGAQLPPPRPQLLRLAALTGGGGGTGGVRQLLNTSCSAQSLCTPALNSFMSPITHSPFELYRSTSEVSNSTETNSSFRGGSPRAGNGGNCGGAAAVARGLKSGGGRPPMVQPWGSCGVDTLSDDDTQQSCTRGSSCSLATAEEQGRRRGSLELLSPWRKALGEWGSGSGPAVAPPQHGSVFAMIPTPSGHYEYLPQRGQQPQQQLSWIDERPPHLPGPLFESLSEPAAAAASSPYAATAAASTRDTTGSSNGTTTSSNGYSYLIDGNSPRPFPTRTLVISATGRSSSSNNPRAAATAARSASDSPRRGATAAAAAAAAFAATAATADEAAGSHSHSDEHDSDGNGSRPSARNSDHLTKGHAALELFLRLNHARQTLDFAKRQAQLFADLRIAEMSVWEALSLLNELRDYESALMGSEDLDPDLPLMDHAVQTAELCRTTFPDKDWMALAGLMHGLGKLLAHRKFGAQPQWAVCGETFPLGCRFAAQITCPHFFSVNPDRRRRVHNTPTGIYTPGCGLENVYMSWSAPEYLYTALVLNQTALPLDALFVLRHQRFLALTRPGGAYQQLLSEDDRRRLPMLAAFQSCCHYSRRDLPDGALRGQAFQDHYNALIMKYLGPEKLFW